MAGSRGRSSRSALRSHPFLPAALALGILAAGAALAESIPAAGGVRLFECLEEGPLAVVGEIASTRKLDDHGRAARIVVERTLTGEVERGTELPIVWSERSLSRPERFAPEDRVLLCLGALPPQSIWRQRLPDPEQRLRTLAVAERGDAFLRHPSLGGLDVLAHYLALGRDREGPTGASHLSRLAARAEPQLASLAAERLSRFPELGERLEPQAGAALAEALVRPDGTAALRSAVLDLIGERRPKAVRPPLEALAAADDPPAVVWTALARLDGELGADRAALLFDSENADVREAAARYAPRGKAERQLGRLARTDPVPEVRAAAIERLVALQGERAIDTALATLDDPELRVRAAAGRSLATLGPSVVPILRGVVDSGGPEAAQAAVGALKWTETREAQAELEEIAETHPDPSVRTLAELAIGRPLGHRH